MSKEEKENRINSLAVTFLERQQIQPNIFADQIIRGYKEGYHQAEKDLELTWEDMEMVFDLCYEVLRDVYLMKFPDDKEEQQDFYQEVLKRFKNLKK